MSGCLNVLMADNAAAVSTAKSLVLASASSQYLSRTWGASPTNANIATLNFFVKRVSTGGADFFQAVYDGGLWDGNAGIDSSEARFDFGGTLTQMAYNGGIVSQFTSTDTITDTTDWHNVHFLFDSSDGTANHRVRIYIDGVEVAYGTQTAPTQNTTFGLTVNGVASAIGRRQASTNRYLDAKLAYFYFIDGQALTPSSFTTGTGASIHPAAYGGAYGTNGFKLDFRSSSTADQSGNGNNWTQNNSPTFDTDLPT